MKNYITLSAIGAGLGWAFFGPIGGIVGALTGLGVSKTSIANKFGDESDIQILRLNSLELLRFLRVRGIPQYATGSVLSFQRSWNTVNPDQPLLTDGKYTQDVQGALDAALQGLAPRAGYAPQAML